MQYMIVVFPDHTRLPFGQDVRLDCEHKMSFWLSPALFKN